MYEHKPPLYKLPAIIVHLVKDFVQRDDNSSTTRGQKINNHEKKGQETEEIVDGHCQEQKVHY